MPAHLTVETGRYKASIGKVMFQYEEESIHLVEKLVDRIVNFAQGGAPRLKEADRRFYPGELADSIKASRTSRTSWFIGAYVRWAAYVEFGTARHGRAQAYMRPAVALAAAVWRLMR